VKRRKIIIGYGRTSTFDQAAGLAALERDLKAAGATKLFTEQVSSVAQRARLAECLAFLREGDVLMVTRPDRLARSTAELLGIEADLSKRKIDLAILAMGGELAVGWDNPMSTFFAQVEEDNPADEDDAIVLAKLLEFVERSSP
jgi:DNA invertase Pin-like site-specific DNA recombinase